MTLREGLAAAILFCCGDAPAAEYRRLLAGEKHQVLSGCAHFPWEENPDEYYAALHRLLGEP